MIRENSPYRLLVEGSDDQHSVIHLMKRHGIDWDDPKATLPHVHDCGGFDPLHDSLVVSAKSYERLGIIVDANSDIERRWTQVQDKLHTAGLALPEAPKEDGLIVPGIFDDWEVGVWIMPDNQAKGELEDFLGKLIPSGDQRWGYACEATQHAKEIGAAFSDKDRSKANLHTWLAWQKEPGRPFGTAITAKYFHVDSPEALRFVQWFKALFC